MKPDEEPFFKQGEDVLHRQLGLDNFSLSNGEENPTRKWQRQTPFVHKIAPEVIQELRDLYNRSKWLAIDSYNAAQCGLPFDWEALEERNTASNSTK